MSTTLSGDQFVVEGDVHTYLVTGIPSGYSLNDTEYPEGWTSGIPGPLLAGSQSFDLTVGIGSGTIVISYINAQSIVITVYLDVYSGATRKGEEIMAQGVIFVPSPNPSPPSFCDADPCVYPLTVFADPDAPTNKLNNDNSDFYFWGNSGITAIELILQKKTDGAWADIETLTDSTYGSFFAFGKHPDFSGNSFVDDFNKQYTGIFLSWLLVYTDYGTGNYRLKVTYTDIFGDDTIVYSKAEYCLKKWTCFLTDGTFRFETLNQGLRGTLDDKTVQVDYSTGWRGEMRLRGMFKRLDPSYNREYNQYGDADYNSFKPYIDEQIPKYRLQIKQVPGWIDYYVSTNVLQADEILMTDYNSKNRHTFVKTPVKDGTFTLVNEMYINPLATIELEFLYGQNNLRKRNS